MVYLLLMMKYFIAIFLFSSIFFFGQNKDPEIELLLTKYKSSLNKDLDSAIYYINKIKVISKSKGNKFYLSRGYYGMGYCLYQKGDIKKALNYINASIPIAIESNNFQTLALAYNQLGFIKNNESDYNAAIQLYLKSLKISEKNGLSQKSITLKNLGNLFLYQRDSVQAIKYYKEDYQFTNRKELIAEHFGSCNNLGVILRKRKPDSSLYYFNKGLSIANQLDNRQWQYDVHINLSLLYMSNNKYKNYNKTLSHLNAVKKLINDIGDSNLYFLYYYNLGGYFYKQNQYPQAINNYVKAEKTAQNPTILFDHKIALMNDLKEAFEKNGDYKKAYQYQKIYHQLNDSIFSVEKAKNINEIITKYEVDKKNNQIKLLNQQKEYQEKKSKLVLISSLLFILILIGILYFVYKKSQFEKKLRHQENINHNQETQKLIQDQKLNEMSALIKGQDFERNRIAKDLHDGVAGDLAGIKLLLAKENADLSNQNIEKIQDNLSDVFQEIRQISHNLSLNNLKDKNLKDLLLGLEVNYRKRNEFSFEMHIYPEDALDDLSEINKINIYRILQELLNNISKHAKATEVELSINRHLNDINIIITDNGIGFKIDIKGVGLKNIQERLQTISGEMDIQSDLNKGTSIVIELKL